MSKNRPSTKGMSKRSPIKRVRSVNLTMRSDASSDTKFLGVACPGSFSWCTRGKKKKKKTGESLSLFMSSFSRELEKENFLTASCGEKPWSEPSGLTGRGYVFSLRRGEGEHQGFNFSQEGEEHRATMKGKPFTCAIKKKTSR